MTFIEFGKRGVTKRVATAMIGVFVCSVIAVVFAYQNTINLRHDVQQSQKDLADLKVENAELKNNFYTITDTVSHEAFLQERGFVLDENPHYVQIPSVPTHVILR